MELLIPHFGTLVWMTLCFSIVLFILKRFAWKPILGALKSREESIEEALKSAENARLQMKQLQSDNEKIMAEAKLDRDRILKEARELKDDIINEARKRAIEESDKIVAGARESIKAEKAEAVKEIKEQIADFSIIVAEKILREKLQSNSEQKVLIDRYLQDIKIN